MGRCAGRRRHRIRAGRQGARPRARAAEPVGRPLKPAAAGALAAAGAPALASGATFFAFGAAAAGHDLPALWAMAASAAVYGMAGQMVLLDAAAVGVLPATLGAVSANARFLPMAVAIAPLFRPRTRWWALPFLAVTPWAAAIRALPAMSVAARLPWFLGFGVTAWAIGLAATLAGHRLAPTLDAATQRALLAANPLYFGLLLAADLPRRGPRGAILAGISAAPLALFLPPGWGLIAAGLLGGTMAFWWERRSGGR